MGKQTGLAQGWLRTEIGTAVQETQKKTYISKELKKSFQTAVITLDKSDRLERTELSQNPQRRIAHR